MQTAFQHSQNAAANKIIKADFDKLAAEFPGYVDTIFASPDRHGKGKLGFTCRFAGYATYVSGQTLLEFAVKSFGAGKHYLKPTGIGPNGIGRQYHVIANR